MYEAKSKVLISFVVTAKLICVFVFAYAKCWFSHDAVQLQRLDLIKHYMPLFAISIVSARQF